MESTLIITAVVAIMSALVKFLDVGDERVGKWLKYTHIITLALSFLLVFFSISDPDYRLGGPYTLTAVGLTCLLSGILLFGFTRSRRASIYSGILGVYSLLAGVGYVANLMLLLLPATIGYIIFQPPQFTQKINAEYRLEESAAFMKRPLNRFRLRKRVALIFEKEIPLQNPPLHYPIENPEVVHFEENKFLICKFRNLDSTRQMRTDTFWYTT